MIVWRIVFSQVGRSPTGLARSARETGSVTGRAATNALPRLAEIKLTSTINSPSFLILSSMENNTKAPIPKEASSTAGSSRKLKSEVWQFFDYQPSSGAGEKDDKAVCKVCGCPLSAYSPNGTRHLWGHISSTRCMDVINVLQGQGSPLSWTR